MADKSTCDKHPNSTMKQIPAGVSKKSGQPYNAFWVCDVCDTEKRKGFGSGLKEVNEKLDKILEYIEANK